MPVPRAEKSGILQSPGHAESPWEGFLLHSALFLFLAVVNDDGVWPVVLRLTD